MSPLQNDKPLPDAPEDWVGASRSADADPIESTVPDGHVAGESPTAVAEEETFTFDDLFTRTMETGSVGDHSLRLEDYDRLLKQIVTGVASTDVLRGSYGRISPSLASLEEAGSQNRRDGADPSSRLAQPLYPTSVRNAERHGITPPSLSHPSSTVPPCDMLGFEDMSFAERDLSSALFDRFSVDSAGDITEQAVRMNCPPNSCTLQDGPLQRLLNPGASYGASHGSYNSPQTSLAVNPALSIQHESNITGNSSQDTRGPQFVSTARTLGDGLQHMPFPDVTSQVIPSTPPSNRLMMTDQPSAGPSSFDAWSDSPNPLTQNAAAPASRKRKRMPAGSNFAEASASNSNDLGLILPPRKKVARQRLTKKESTPASLPFQNMAPSCAPHQSSFDRHHMTSPTSNMLNLSAMREPFTNEATPAAGPSTRKRKATDPDVEDNAPPASNEGPSFVRPPRKKVARERPGAKALDPKSVPTSGPFSLPDTRSAVDGTSTGNKAGKRKANAPRSKLTNRGKKDQLVLIHESGERVSTQNMVDALGIRTLFPEDHMFPCPFPECKETRLSAELMRHFGEHFRELRHDESGSIKCPRCSKSFRALGAVKRHLRDRHLKALSKTCSVCHSDISRGTPDQIERHFYATKHEAVHEQLGLKWVRLDVLNGNGDGDADADADADGIDDNDNLNEIRDGDKQEGLSEDVRQREDD